MTKMTLRSQLSKPPIVVAPGVFDPLTALIATQAGFQIARVRQVSIHRVPGRQGESGRWGKARPPLYRMDHHVIGQFGCQITLCIVQTGQGTRSGE